MEAGHSGHVAGLISASHHGKKEREQDARAPLPASDLLPWKQFRILSWIYLLYTGCWSTAASLFKSVGLG
jgi:hypothetical protein